MVRLRTPICAILASAGIWLAACPPTRAGVDATLVTRYHDASRSLLQLASRRGTDLPRVSDPHVRALFDELDWRTIRSAAPHGSADVSRLLAIQGELSPLLHLYQERSDARGRADLLVNWRIYQDELTPLSSLLLDVSLATHQALLDFLGKLPLDEITTIRLAGLKGATANLAEQVRGLLTMINCDGITDDNRRQFSAALRRNADALASYADPSALAPLRAAALELATEARNEAVREDLEAFGRPHSP